MSRLLTELIEKNNSDAQTKECNALNTATKSNDLQNVLNHDIFDKLYLKCVLNKDEEAQKRLTDLSFPYFYKYVVKNCTFIDDPREYASYIYDIIYNYVKKLPEKKEKSYYKFTTALRIAIKRSLLSLVDHSNKINQNEISDDECNNVVIDIIEDNILDTSAKEHINSLLSVLTPKQRLIIQMHFGLLGGEGKNFVTIAKELNISKEAVGKLYRKAIKKLRNPSVNYVIKEYY